MLFLTNTGFKALAHGDILLQFNMDTLGYSDTAYLLSQAVLVWPINENLI